MNRNVNSAFAYNPTNLDISRSKFSCDHSYKTTFNVSEIIPFEVTEVLPGDTWQYKTSKVVRMQSLITPMMDNIYLDTYFFFVPNRLIWKHWKEFMGENTESKWIPTTEYNIPKIESPANGWNIGTIADYMGVPTGIEYKGDNAINALPFRAYAMICNEFFRSENLQDYLLIPDDETTQSGSNGYDYVNDLANGGLPYKACKFFDVFTGALPSPQKGPDVIVPLAQYALSGNTQGDVFTSLTHHDSGSVYPIMGVPVEASYHPLKSMITWSDSGLGDEGYHTVANTQYGNACSHDALSSYPNSPLNGDDFANSYANVGYSSSGWQANGTSSSNYLRVQSIAPNNLYADLSGLSLTSSGGNTTINQLRLAFQIQKLYEKDSMGGSRYIEVLKAHFGVTSPDYRLQRPEYLGGNRITLNVQSVTQTSATGATGTPQGNQAAYSVTTDNHGEFIKSFTEHGYIIGVMVARYKHSYQQGLEKMWKRNERLDYYFPVFANIGEQKVSLGEIYSTGTSADNNAFGYQEAWYDYRYRPDKVTGEMRSSATTSLDIWHLADDYATAPTLSEDWIVEDKSNVDRVLAVKSSVSNQLFADLYISATATRPMPVYSIPGLIDHH